MIHAFIDLVHPLTFVIILGASILGVILGAIPGLSGGLGVALLLPVTFGMEAATGLAMLVAIWVGGVSGAMVGSILLGIPGSPSAIATCFDGYPMTRKGQAVKALGAAITASFLGTFFSILIAAWLSPIIADLALKLGPWEYFSLGFCAIALVASLSRDNVGKGMAAAALGLLAACVGFAPIDGTARFSFGNMYLSSGFDLIAMMLGLFALKQIVMDFARGTRAVQKVEARNISGFGVTLQEFRDNAWNLVRSFGIGIWIGFLPGMGAALSNMVAYAQAKSASKHPEKFGKGCIDGVFASEVSNNASVGGSVIPMIALGIPGDGTTAILLGGLMIHGIQPGPLLFTNNPEIVYTVFATALLSAVMVLVVQFFGMRLFPAILKVPYHYLYPPIVVLSFVGVFVNTGGAYIFAMLLGFAALGILMDLVKLPISPFILAFILGPMLESNLRKGFTYSTDGAWAFLTRPISAGLLAIAVFSILWPYLKPLLIRRRLSHG
ncbi:tripartite tricarboxylate transporter permease [Pseudooceanicola sp. CBS1P-1]|uniref:Tat pathway signal protein n=1 Tax=Pseudooceanicola albus TaxID=2692189 RepID=A0A6L7G8M4_9RHOB|nr:MULTISPECIES: tripartite tricarboxylate transporter permease [Pseudooceanicola]MBT9386259.1 tripartite tricarboxylate transporter permease [Pseudooceanicola endophyticus]MXN20309.1 Tat pathway signal protein [Pseudooceanicola albus]